MTLRLRASDDIRYISERQRGRERDEIPYRSESERDMTFAM